MQSLQANSLSNNRLAYQETRSQCLGRLGKRVIGIIVFLPLQAIKIIALALSCFGCFNNLASSSIKDFATRLQLSCLSHVSDDQTRCKFPRLFPLKNKGTISSILFGSDRKFIREFLKKLTSLSPFDKTKIEKLPIEAPSDGICFGASLVLIQAIMKGTIKTEKQLIQTMVQFRTGFPAAAMALQHVCNAVKSAELFSAFPSKSDLAAAKAKYRQTRNPEAVQNTYLGAIFEYCYSIASLTAPLINLNVSSDRKRHLIFYNQMDSSSALNGFRSQFNHLKNGCYTIYLKTDADMHSIVYLKMDFGSYLIDPNYGLIKCPDFAPISELINLMNHYNPDRSKQSATVLGFSSSS